MSLSARRSPLRTTDLDRRRTEAKARRRELEAFFRGHLAEVKHRLAVATKSYDDKRSYWHRKRLKQTHAQAFDENPFAATSPRRRKQLWQVEGDGCGQ